MATKKNYTPAQLQWNQGDGIQDIEGKLLGGIARQPWTQALASAARTATTVTADIDPGPYSGVIILVNITAASGSGGLYPALALGTNPTGSASWLANATGRQTTVVCTAYWFGRNIVSAGAGGVAINYPYLPITLPAPFRIAISHGDATSYTYDVQYQLIA